MNQELDKKLAEWAGFKAGEVFTQGMLTGHQHFDAPDGTAFLDIDMPNFTQSLDACFKWLVPKLNLLWGSTGRLEFHPGKGITTCYIFLSNGVFEGASEESSLALCLALEKLADKGVSDAEQETT